MLNIKNKLKILYNGSTKYYLACGRGIEHKFHQKLINYNIDFDLYYLASLQEIEYENWKC